MGGGYKSLYSDFINSLSEHGWQRIFWNNNRIGENPDKLYNIIGVPMHHMNPFVSPLWFIRDLMVVMLLSPVVYAFVKYCRLYGLAVVAVLLSLNIWVPIEGFSATAFFFFSLGAYFQVNNKSFLLDFRKIEKLSYMLTVLLLIASLIIYGYNNLLSEVFRKLFSIFGVISIVNISGYLIKHEKVRIYPTLAASSFFIYATHTIYVDEISSYITRSVLPFNNTAGYISAYFMQAFITVVICVGGYMLMNKICPRLLSVLTGGR